MIKMTYQERKQSLIDHMPDGIGVDRSKLSELMIEFQNEAFCEAWERSCINLFGMVGHDYSDELNIELKEYGLIP